MEAEADRIHFLSQGPFETPLRGIRGLWTRFAETRRSPTGLGHTQNVRFVVA